MQRRKFIQLLSLTSLGASFSSPLWANNSLENARLLAIDKVNLHNRHGFFNLHTQTNKAFSVQRDILLRDGLTEVIQDRISSIKINSGSESFFAVLSPEKIQTETNRLEIIQLKANEKTTINVSKNAMLFSEYEAFIINHTKIKSDACYKVNKASLLNIVSKHDQYLMVFKS